MRELTYFVAVSLDGHIAGQGGDISAFPQGDHIGWLLAEYPDTLPAPFLAAMQKEANNAHFDTVLMGRRTYQLGVDQGLTNPYPHLRQIVFSRSPQSLDEAVTMTDEDPRTVVQRLREEPGGGMWLCGGGQLAAQLMPLIDRLVLKVAPVLLPGGVPLFAPTDGPASTWTLEQSQTFDSGVVVNHLRRG